MVGGVWMERILLVEDDGAILRALSEFLEREGFSAEGVSTQQEGLARLDSGRYSIVLLDISLPDGSGYAICRIAKEKNLPVIFLTASDDEHSVVNGLDMGADDYIAKPFRPRELVSRIKSVLRRYRIGSECIALGPVLVDTDKAIVSKQGKELILSALEYRILLVFANHPGVVLTRDRLLEEIWDIGGDFVNDNTLTVYIKRLREKIEDDPQNPVIIRTVRGMGYRAE